LVEFRVTEPVDGASTGRKSRVQNRRRRIRHLRSDANWERVREWGGRRTWEGEKKIIQQANGQDGSNNTRSG